MIEYLLQLRAFLQGKKTYLSMLAGALTALAGWSNGVITDAELMRALFEASGFITLRAGVNNALNGGNKQ